MRFLALPLALLALVIASPAPAQSTGGGGGGGVTNCNSGLVFAAGICSLDQTFAPTWTGLHTFTPGANNQAIQINDSLTGASTGIIGINFTTTLNTTGDPSCVFLCATITNTACGPNCNFINFGSAFVLSKNGQGTFGGNLLSAGNVVASNTGGTGSVGVAGTGCYNFVNSMFCSTAATVSGTGLGTSPSVTPNGSAAMDITVGTAPAAATFTLTFAAVAHGFACSGSDITNPGATNLKMAGTGSTTTAIMENFNNSGTATALTASDHLRILCIGY